MKSKFTCLVLFSLAPFLINAQTITPFIGWTQTHSTLGNTVQSGYSSTERRVLDFVGGVLLDLPLNDRFQFETGLGFAQRGFVRRDEYTSEELRAEYQRGYNFNFLEVPVNASFIVIKNKWVRIAVKAGPRVSYLAGGKVLHASHTNGFILYTSVIGPSDGSADIRQSDDIQGFPDSGNMEYYYVKTRFAVALNAAVEIRIMERATIDVTWVEGMTHYSMFNDTESRLRGFQLTFGYPIRLK